MEELSTKEKLLRVIVRMKKKRKVKKVDSPQLTIDGVPSTLFADDKVNNRHRSSDETRDLKKKLKEIAGS